MNKFKVILGSFLIFVINSCLYAGTAIVFGKDCAWAIYTSRSPTIAVQKAFKICRSRGCPKAHMAKYYSGKGYSAIATNDSTYDCHYGYAFRHPSIRSAKNAALNSCERNNNGAVCQIRYIKYINSR